VTLSATRRVGDASGCPCIGGGVVFPAGV
jgi:hypothetical protein